jgi:hypothetical protein
MPNAHSIEVWKRLADRLKRKYVIATILTILLLVWPSASAGAQNANAPPDSVIASAPPDSVTVPISLIEQANATIDEQDEEIIFLEKKLEAQKQYYIELLELKDERVQILEDTIEDALGSPTKDFLDKLLWGLAGYGVGKLADE